MSREVEFAADPDADLVAYIADCAFNAQGNGRHDGDIVVEDPRGRSDSRRHTRNLPTIDVVSRLGTAQATTAGTNGPPSALDSAFCSTVVLD